jgi:hypothetical protein
MEYQGDSQIQSAKLQGLHLVFENLSMKDDEGIRDYFARVMDNVAKQRSYGEEILDQKIIEKILRSLTPKFDYIIPSIEVVFDMAEVTQEKLMGMLQSQEERVNNRSPVSKATKTIEAQEEKALQVFHNLPKTPRGRG